MTNLSSLGNLYILNEINHKFVMIRPYLGIKWNKTKIYYDYAIRMY